MMRALFSLVFVCLFSITAWAQERITNFDVDIDVQKNGDMIVTENIRIQDASDQSRRGIFRELPRTYRFMGVEQGYKYELLSITRDGKSESYSRQTNGNAIVWRIGNASIYLPNGPHNYEIKYRIKDQIRHHYEGETAVKDEVYWNATGDFWPYPIENASATISFPRGVKILEHQAYTGRSGVAGSNFKAEKRRYEVEFETTRALRAKEGLTVSVIVEPGVLDPMTDARRKELGWIRTGGPVLLGLGGLGLLFYYMMMWMRVGRDPAKQPVFPRYGPPKGYSPAAVHHIFYRGFKKMNALTSTLMALSTKDVLDIHAEKKKTTISSMLANKSTAPLLKDEVKLLDILFGDRDGKIVMDKTTDTSFYRKVTRFTQYISKTYGKNYYRSNAGWGLLGMAISGLIVFYVMGQPVSKSGPLFLAILLGIAAMNILFYILLKAPTKKGAITRAEIEGFRLYLETAEENRINTANPIGERPPAMTVELYERFLPYAVALGVEKSWTKQFETTMPLEAKNYQPSYAHGSMMDGRGGNPFKMSDALATAMTAGVAAAAPVSQSSSSGGFSSGSSGGGFSGGGGGGGGGGSW